MTMARLTSADAYDRTSRYLHWIIAFVVVGQWLGAHAIDWFPKGPLRVDVRSVHIVFGAILAIAIGFRLYWRLFYGARFAREMTAVGLLAECVHVGLYLLMLTIVCLGLFTAWLRGDDLFGLGHIPKFGVYSDIMRHQLVEKVVGLHSLAANAILFVAGFHALAALMHYFVLKDSVLQRMVPGLSPRK